MALELLSTLEPAEGCVGFTFTDTTGVYNADTNPGGYGTPNPATNDVGLVTISIYPPLATVPYLFSFGIATGTVESATVTAPDGTVTDILADLTGITFPFNTDNAITILPECLGFEEDAMVTDGVWTSVYEITLADESTYNTTTYILSKCATSCCIVKMFVNLTDCSCEGDAQKAAWDAKSKLMSAIYSADMGMMTAAQENLTKASEICAGNCTNCG